MKKIFLAAMMATSMISIAHAADVAVPTPVEEAPAIQAPSTTDNGMGFYLGTLSSVNFLKHTDFDIAGVGISTKYDTGYYGAIRGGYNFGSIGYVTPRAELELGYGSSSVDEHRIAGFGGVGGIDSYGDARTLQGFVNGYLDIPLTPVDNSGFLAAFTPYVGGGVGAINLNLKKQGIGGVGTLIDDNSTKFAYHLDAGVGINLDAIPALAKSPVFHKTTLEVGYRYTAADNFGFTARDGSTSSTDLRSNAVTIGLRHAF